jgi:cytochrome c peroxidase
MLTPAKLGDADASLCSMMRRNNLSQIMVFGLLQFSAIACDRQADRSDFTGMQLTPLQLQESTTNSVADDPMAASFGRKLFFDPGLSSDATVACANCHDPEHGFSDPKAFSLGVRGQAGSRHSMPVTAAVLHPFLLWDGRADSAWSQPLKALENPKEMDFTRAEVAHYVQQVYGAEYNTVFGALPGLNAVPPRALPGDAAWNAMPVALQEDVERVFANVGKAIEAYERKLLCSNTRFDRWQRGELEFSEAELDGATTFDRENCANCHSGPTFSDGEFHDIGIPSRDRGRALGASQLLADAFNGAGEFSDDVTAGEGKLSEVSNELEQNGAFRTASLRGVGQRTFFGHAAHEKSLRGFILDIYRGRGRRDDDRDGRRATVGELDEKLDGVDVDADQVDDLIAFLHTLDCPSPPAELLAP